MLLHAKYIHLLVNLTTSKQYAEDLHARQTINIIKLVQLHAITDNNTFYMHY